MQFYNGTADWDAIRAVRDVISVPLVANGDVATTADANEILKRSGADAVMIGRSSQGRPWHAGVLAGAVKHPDSAAIADIIAEHYNMMLEFYGADIGLRHARKHLGWYLDRFAPQLEPQEKAAIMTSTEPSTVMSRAVAAIAAGSGRQEEKDAA